MLSSVVTGMIINPMPVGVEENEDLMNRFHKISSISPMQNAASFVKYTTQSCTILVIVISEIFKSIGLIFSESVSAKEDGKKEFIKWSKSALYYSWVSFCLPFIFLGGYATKFCREPLDKAPVPLTEFSARRKALALEEELSDVKGLVNAKEKEEAETADLVVALRLQMSEFGAGRQGQAALTQEELIMAVAPILQSVTEGLQTQINALEEEALRLRERDVNITAHERELESEGARNRERIIQLESQIEQNSSVGMRALIRRLATESRQSQGSVTITREELNRAFKK